MWDDDSRAELQREYERIGYHKGELWPFPENLDEPAAFLALLRRVPDGAGLSGYLEALKEVADTDA